jgi:hypothetical protein
MNKPKSCDNSAVARFLEGYYSAADICEDFPEVDDIFSGVLALRTEGVTSTRALSRQVLFHILRQCETIDVDSVNAATNELYAYRSLAGYAAIARVASKAMGRFVRAVEANCGVVSVAQQRRDIDAPYQVALEAVRGQLP